MTDDLTNFSEQSQEENYLHELRPKLFEDFSGQQSVVDNLKILSSKSKKSSSGSCFTLWSSRFRKQL